MKRDIRKMQANHMSSRQIASIVNNIDGSMVNMKHIYNEIVKIRLQRFGSINASK